MLGVLNFWIFMMYSSSSFSKRIFILSSLLIAFISSSDSKYSAPLTDFHVSPEFKLYSQFRVLYSSSKTIFLAFSPSNEKFATLFTSVFSYKFTIASEANIP